jgi:hypothetical protein
MFKVHKGPVGPKVLTQGLARHQRTWALDQGRKHLQRLTLNSDLHASTTPFQR